VRVALHVRFAQAQQPDGIKVDDDPMSQCTYLAKIRILVVDDNAFMRTIIRRILGALGCTDVREAGDGAEALKILQSWAADIVLLDWEMSPFNGIEFTKMVRRIEDNTNTFLPIIMISAHSEFWRIRQARDAGVNEFLVKPISAKMIYQRIRNVIEKPRPFVHAPGFFGPDRRRQELNHGEERRIHDPDYVGDEQIMEQHEIDSYFNPDTEHAKDQVGTVDT